MHHASGPKFSIPWRSSQAAEDLHARVGWSKIASWCPREWWPPFWSNKSRDGTDNYNIFCEYLGEGRGCPHLLSTMSLWEWIRSKYNAERTSPSPLAQEWKRLFTGTETKDRCQRFYEAKSYRTWLSFPSSNMTFRFTWITRCLCHYLSCEREANW